MPSAASSETRTAARHGGLAEVGGAIQGVVEQALGRLDRARRRGQRLAQREGHDQTQVVGDHLVDRAPALGVRRADRIAREQQPGPGLADLADQVNHDDGRDQAA